MSSSSAYKKKLIEDALPLDGVCAREIHSSRTSLNPALVVGASSASDGSRRDLGVARR